MTRLKDVAIINRAALPEATAPDRLLNYVDIGSVSGLGSFESQEVLFREAPSRARRLVQPGDSIVSTVRTYLRAVAYIGDEAKDIVVSTGFATLTPRDGINSRFLYWLARGSDFIEDVVSRSVGVSYPAITATELGTVEVTVPSLPRQRRVAAFLDAATARIDELIGEQENLRALLAEHRHALVSTAIGSRLGGSATSLEGGLSDLPLSWKLVPLRAVSVVQSGLTLGKRYEDPVEERPYLRVANVQDGWLDLSEVTTIHVPRMVSSRCELQPGDVLMTEGGDNDKLGRGTVWRGEIARCLHQNHIFAVRPDAERLRPEYLAMLTTSAWGRAYFTATAHQTTNLAGTNRQKIARFPVPLPPLQEQDSILSSVARHMSQLDMLETEIRCQVALLREHRQALITAAVTGGLDALDQVT